MPLPPIPAGTPIATGLSAKEQATGLGCPVCYTGGTGPANMLYARAGKFAYYCKFGHEFQDQQELMAMKPPKLELAPPKEAAQAGWVPLTLQLPPSVLSGLRERFGDRLSATLTQIFRTLTAGRVFVIGEEDIARAESKFGQKFHGLQQFMGEVISVNDKLADERQRRETAEKSQGQSTQTVDGQPVRMRRGETVIWFNPDVMVKLKQKSEARGIEFEAFLEETVQTALENEWI